ncbi:FXYD domain-containing ion transport regulator 3-like isoform X4 [Zonotrichia albicollis]|uniref:FXYD domain-containing ion transport regulator 3-like isoform X4 n=1 Tax=Zonotrichia albicollis TaxID=44394 RepID=UPI003D80D733
MATPLLSLATPPQLAPPLPAPSPPPFPVPAAALGSSLKGHGMERERLRALVILGVLSLARGDPPGASSPFQYDWCHLRVGGLVVAAVLSVLGIAVLFSGKCKCRSKARSLRCPQASPEWPQNVPKCPQIPKNDPKMTPNGPKCPQIAQK